MTIPILEAIPCPDCHQECPRVFSVPQIITKSWRSSLKSSGQDGTLQQADMGVFDLIGKDPVTNKNYADINYEPHQ